VNVLVIEPGHGSHWLQHAYYVDRYGNPNPLGRFVRGDTWEYDGAWNMPDDYSGQWEPYTTYRKFILKIERES
jgi:hypothetical protein